MIITSIKDSIVSKLKSLYPSYDVYDEMMMQGLEEPCFFVKILPEGKVSKEVGNRYKVDLSFDIHYFLDENTDNLNEQYHSMAEVLYEALEVFPDLSGGYLRGLNKRHEIQDGVLHFFVDISQFAKVEVENVLMQEVNENLFVKD